MRFCIWLDNLEFVISYAAVRNLGNEVRTGLQIFNEVLNISFRCYYHYYITINLLRRRKTSCLRKLAVHITWKYDQCTDPFILSFRKKKVFVRNLTIVCSILLIWKWWSVSHQFFFAKSKDEFHQDLHILSKAGKVSSHRFYNWSPMID